MERSIQDHIDKSLEEQKRWFKEAFKDWLTEAWCEKGMERSADFVSKER